MSEDEQDMKGRPAILAPTAKKVSVVQGKATRPQHLSVDECVSSDDAAIPHRGGFRSGDPKAVSREDRRQQRRGESSRLNRGGAARRVDGHRSGRPQKQEKKQKSASSRGHVSAVDRPQRPKERRQGADRVTSAVKVEPGPLSCGTEKEEASSLSENPEAFHDEKSALRRNIKKVEAECVGDKKLVGIKAKLERQWEALGPAFQAKVRPHPEKVLEEVEALAKACGELAERLEGKLEGSLKAEADEFSALSERYSTIQKTVQNTFACITVYRGQKANEKLTASSSEKYQLRLIYDGLEAGGWPGKLSKRIASWFRALAPDSDTSASAPFDSTKIPLLDGEALKAIIGLREQAEQDFSVFWQRIVADLAVEKNQGWKSGSLITPLRDASWAKAFPVQVEFAGDVSCLEREG